MNAAQLLPLIRTLYSRRPETFYLKPHELQWLLFALRYTDDLEDEGESAAAVEVARMDYPQWRRVA
jgi:hypothetical protein